MFHRFHLRREACLVLALLIALALAVLPERAEAGRYVVAQCDPANRGTADASFERRNGGDYGFQHRCEEDEEANSLQIHTITAAPQNHFGRISWAAPGEARIVALGLEARLRSDAGQQARLSFLEPNGAEAARIATGSQDAGGFDRYERRLSGAGRERFAASLVCVARAGCPDSDRARTWIRSVRLTIDDRDAPSRRSPGVASPPGGIAGRSAWPPRPPTPARASVASRSRSVTGGSARRRPSPARLWRAPRSQPGCGHARPIAGSRQPSIPARPRLPTASIGLRSARATTAPPARRAARSDSSPWTTRPRGGVRGRRAPRRPRADSRARRRSALRRRRGRDLLPAGERRLLARAADHAGGRRAPRPCRFGL